MNELMITLAKFHFLRPDWLWLLLPLLVMLILSVRRSNSGDWQTQVDRELLPYLLEGTNRSPGYGGRIVLALSGVLAVTAIAGPVWRELPQPLFRNQSGIVLALDLSRSMNATDLKPDRISRARFKISDIINAWPDGQIALLVYAADAYTVTPLTDDRATLELQLPALDTNLMPAQGSNSLAAIELARQLLSQAALVNGEIWLLTDGLTDVADLDELIDAAGDYPISVLGIGTTEGAPISTGNGFLKDRGGNIVLPKLREAPLRALAASSGGRYSRLKGDNGDIDHLLAGAGLADINSGDEQEDRRADLWQEEGPWLLLPLLLLAALAFRRGYLVILLAVMITPPPASAEDQLTIPADNRQISWRNSWQNLWQTPDQRAQQAFDRGDNQSAIEDFINPEWQAVARYRQGDYQGAAEALADRTDPESLYNRGNAKAMQGYYQGALDDYDQVLAEQPDNQDARFNRDLVQKQLEQQQQKQQESGDQGENDESESEPGSDSGEESQSDGQSDEQSGDQSGDSGSEQDSHESGDQSDKTDPGNNQPPNEQTEHRSEDNGDNEEQQSPAQQANQIEDAVEPTEPSTINSFDAMDEETRQATEQWLRRIPDDPGGLLRRKFQYQYQRRNGSTNQQGDGW